MDELIEPMNYSLYHNYYNNIKINHFKLLISLMDFLLESILASNHEP